MPVEHVSFRRRHRPGQCASARENLSGRRVSGHQVSARIACKNQPARSRENTRSAAVPNTRINMVFQRDLTGLVIDRGQVTRNSSVLPPLSDLPPSPMAPRGSVSVR